MAIEAAPDGTVYLVDEDGSRLLWLDPDGVALETIPVGQRIDVRRDRVGPFLFAPPIAYAAPTGVATARYGDGIRVYVTLRDGAILAFERDARGSAG